MKKIIQIVLFLVLILVIALPQAGAEEEEQELAVDARSAILMEPTTLEVIYEKNPDEKLAPASLTKIMTLILVYEALGKGLISKDTVLTASESVRGIEGTRIFLDVGERMKVEDLLKSIAIGSANDAAVVFAEALGGNVANFAKMMNRKAEQIGCRNTSFKNPNGLPAEGHYTTARDVALMASYLVNKYPDVLNYTKVYEDYVRENTEKRFWLVNTNKLVKFVEGVDGLKTGWTPEAGHCLCATMKKNGMRFVAVVMNCSNNERRNAEALALLNYAVANYNVVPLFKRGEVVKTYEDVSFYPKYYHIVLTEDVNVLSRKGEPLKKVATEIAIDYDNLAYDNKKVGTFKVYYDGKILKEVQLAVREEIKRASYFNILCEVLKEIFLVSGIKT
ncbi:MAG: D-alanyl-D-alanine carboxypeptidase family protein, partial [Bacilli bacterium]|jgi:D-alanyl-D-alanine carboxypeptidase (penicillin-binding protein 5/6)